MIQKQWHYILCLFSLWMQGVTAKKISEKHIAIVTCSYNNAKWYRWNLDAIRTQKYDNYHLFYIDDCSTDGTGDMVQEYIDKYQWHDKVTLIRNEQRQGALYNQYHTIHTYCDDHDIVIICDGDDRPAHDTVLAFINKIYANDSIWLTYGQFKMLSTGERGFCCQMPLEVVRDNAFRTFQDIPSHLRTFYAGLYKKVKYEDLLYEGAFFSMCPDIAVMFPMIEMARDHFRFIPQILLEYNDVNVINEHKVSKELQRSLDLYIRSLSPYDKIDSPFSH